MAKSDRRSEPLHGVAPRSICYGSAGSNGEYGMAGAYADTPASPLNINLARRNEGVIRFGRSDQADHIPLRGGVALDIALRCGERRMPRQFLDVAETAAGLGDLLGRSRDESSPPRMR